MVTKEEYLRQLRIELHKPIENKGKKQIGVNWNCVVITDYESEAEVLFQWELERLTDLEVFLDSNRIVFTAGFNTSEETAVIVDFTSMSAQQISSSLGTWLAEKLKTEDAENRMVTF